MKYLKKIPNTIIINSKRKDPNITATLFNINNFMLNSEFCPVPQGDGPSSKRFYDSIQTLCIPIILSDEIRFPFEDLFINYKKFILQIPMFNSNFLSFIIGFLNNNKKLIIKKNLIKFRKIINFNENFTSNNGDLIWAWLWSQYFKICLISSNKRRNLLENYFL